MSEEQFENLSAKRVHVGRLGTKMEAPLSRRKRISNLEGVEMSFWDLEI